MGAAVLASAAAFCLGAAGCVKKAVSPPLAEGFRLDDPEKARLPILVVENQAFTNADFARYVNLAVGETGSSLNAEAAGRLFDEFIGHKLAAREAAGQGLSLTAEEQKRILEENQPVSGGEEGPVPPAAPEDLLEAALVDKYWSHRIDGLAVGDEEIAAYYESHKSEFLRPERCRISQILASTEAKAQQILSRLRTAGESEFRRAAIAESEGPEAARGGLMGVFSAGQLPPELEKTAFALDEGRISRIVQTEYGYHILRLDQRLPAGFLEIVEAAPLIRTRLLDGRKREALAARLAALKKAVSWRIEAENLPFIYQRGS